MDSRNGLGSLAISVALTDPSQTRSQRGRGRIAAPVPVSSALSCRVSVQKQQDSRKPHPGMDPHQPLDLFSGNGASHQCDDIAATGFHKLCHIKETFRQDQAELARLTAGLFIQQDLILVVDFPAFSKRVTPDFPSVSSCSRLSARPAWLRITDSKAVAVFSYATNLEHQAGVEGRGCLCPCPLGQKPTSQIPAGGGRNAPTMQLRMVRTQITAQSISMGGLVFFEDTGPAFAAGCAVRTQMGTPNYLPWISLRPPSTGPPRTWSFPGPADATSPGKIA